jgi:hypothetical protein
MAVENIISGTIEVMSNESSMAYPSANATNGGELNSEENVREIVNRLTDRSFVLPYIPTEDELLYLDLETLQIGRTFTLSSINNQILTISEGKANIRGYYFKNTNQTTINLFDYIINSDTLRDIYYNWDNYRYIDTSTGAPTITPYVRLYVYLTVKKDSIDHILTYDVENESYSNFKGVVVGLTNDPENSSNYDLLLGYVLVNRDLSIVLTSNEPNRFLSLNIDKLYKLENGTIYNFYDILKQYLDTVSSFHNNITVYGPQNSDNSSYIYLTRPNSATALRFFYNSSNNSGGIELCQPTFDTDGNINGVVDRSELPLITFNNFPEDITQTNNPKLNLGVFTSLPYNTDITENNIYLDGNIIINKVKEVSINGDDQSNINIVSGIINLLGDSGQRSLELNIGDIDTNNDVSVTLNGNITIPNNNNSTTTFIGATTIEASKVFGAVWA